MSVQIDPCCRIVEKENGYIQIIQESLPDEKIHYRESVIIHRDALLKALLKVLGRGVGYEAMSAPGPDSGIPLAFEDSLEAQLRQDPQSPTGDDAPARK